MLRPTSAAGYDSIFLVLVLVPLLDVHSNRSAAFTPLHFTISLMVLPPAHATLQLVARFENEDEEDAALDLAAN